MDSWSGREEEQPMLHIGFPGASNLMSAPFQYKGNIDVNDRYYKEVHTVNEEGRFKGTDL